MYPWNLWGDVTVDEVNATLFYLFQLNYVNFITLAINVHVYGYMFALLA